METKSNIKTLKFRIHSTDYDMLIEKARILGVGINALIIVVIERCLHSFEEHGGINKVQEALHFSASQFDKLSDIYRNDTKEQYLTLNIPSKEIEYFSQELAIPLGLSTIQAINVLIKALHIVGLQQIYALNSDKNHRN